MKRYIPYLAVALITILMILSPESSIFYARSAIDICRDIIVPSLFPFFICSGLLIYSGLCKSLSSFLGPVMRPLFNVGGSGAAALVLGTVSGYPLGAVTACDLYASGYLSKSETERLLAFCNNSGPLFILGAVGIATYSSRKIGAVLYISHLLAAFCVGIIFRFYSRKSHIAPDYAVNQPELGFSEVFSRVLANSLNSILTVCGAVIFFSVFSGLITHYLPVNDSLKAIIIGIFELSGGTRAISETQLSMTGKLVTSAFIVGFAGLCVHMQVAAVVAKHHLSLFPYILGKALHGALSALLTLCYLRLFPQEAAAFKASVQDVGAGFFFGSLYSVINLLFFILLGALIIIFSAMSAARTKKGRIIQ